LWLAALVLSGGAPVTTYAWHLAGKPDRADAPKTEGEGETTELWESLDAEEPVGGADGFWTSPVRHAFVGTIDERHAIAPVAAAATRRRCLRLPRPPPARR